MKTFISLLIIPILCFASCKKEYVVPNKTIVVNLSAGSWIPISNGRGYTAAISIPELDDYMNERGAVLIYISFGSKTYEQIPQVYNGDTFSFVTRPGQIVLETQRYDGLGTVSSPGNLAVKIVLIESNF
jgi:hypothetical protein